jgi:WD40 repeat protein
VPSHGTPQLFASIAAGAIDATFSPDGKSLLAACTDGHIRWWGVDGQLKWVSRGAHEGPARAVAVTPQLIVSGGEDGAIRLWGLDGTPLGEVVKAHDGPVMSVAISPRGELASLGGDEIVRLWKPTGTAAPGQRPKFDSTDLYRPERRNYPEGFGALLRMDTSWGWDHSVGFSPRGDVVAAVLFDRSLRFWNADGTARAVVANPHQQRHVRSLSFSPRGDRLATGGWDSTARLWNLDGSPLRGSINAHLNTVFSVAFSADGTRLATVGHANANFDSVVKIWKADGSRELELPPGHEDRVITVAVADEAPLVAASYEGGVVRLWNLDGSPRGGPLVGHQGFVQALAFAPQKDLLASAGSDGTVRLWDLEGKPQGQPLPAGKGDRIFSKIDLAFSPRGDVLALGTAPFELFDRTRRLWERPMRPADWVRDLAFSPRGDFIVTGSALGDIQVWNVDGSTRVGPLTQRTEYISAVAMAPDGDYFAAVIGASPIITLFNLDGTPRGAPLDAHFGAIRVLAFSPAGRLASGGDDGTLRLWTLPSGEVQTVDVGLPITELGFRGDVLWVRTDESVRFYAQSGTLLATMLLRRESALTYTPDGWYAGSGQGHVLLFDASGLPLPAGAATAHESPTRVVQAIGGPTS